MSLASFWGNDSAWCSVAIFVNYVVDELNFNINIAYNQSDAQPRMAGGKAPISS